MEAVLLCAPWSRVGVALLVLELVLKLLVVIGVTDVPQNIAVDGTVARMWDCSGVACGCGVASR